MQAEMCEECRRLEDNNNADHQRLTYTAKSITAATPAATTDHFQSVWVCANCGYLWSAACQKYCAPS